MKESFWMLLFVVLGLIGLSLLVTVEDIAGTNDHDYYLLKEATEGAMIDAVDIYLYRTQGVVAIKEEKFVENLVRRFADSATSNKSYTLEVLEVNEAPPKVSVRVRTSTGYTIFMSNKDNEFDIGNRIDAILETEY